MKEQRWVGCLAAYFEQRKQRRRARDEGPADEASVIGGAGTPADLARRPEGERDFRARRATERETSRRGIVRTVGRRNKREEREEGGGAAKAAKAGRKRKHTAGIVCCCRERKRKRKIENITDKLFTSRLQKASDRIQGAIGTVAEAICIPELGISDAPKVKHVARPGKPRHKPTPIPVA